MTTLHVKQWTNEEVDKLLEWFLVSRLSYMSLQSRLNRSFHSIDTKIRKMAMGYSKPELAYEPENRTPRDVMPWSTRDIYIYKLWVENEKSGGYEYLAKVLSRSIENIKRFTVPNYGRKGFDL